MANFTISQLEELAIGQGREFDTSQNQGGLNTSHNPPPPERDIRRAIWDVLHVRQKWCSRAEIAAALNLKKSPWLNTHIEQLVEQGYIVREQTVRTNGMVQFWYMLP